MNVSRIRVLSRFVVVDRWCKRRMMSSDTLEMDALKKRVAELEEELRVTKEKYEFEITGRTRAEKALRAKFLEETNQMGSLMQPVGTISSVFATRFGTPRQGALADATRGSILMDRSVVSPDALTGLEGFSHIWLLFVFHENTNMHKAVPDPENPKARKLFPAFVKPPQGGGQRVGLFATRTPHRPNPIGLSLVKLESIDITKGLIHVRGLDLIDGTPILDVKPYVPHVDNPQGIDETTTITIPDWVTNPKFDLVPVEFTAEALAELDIICQEERSKWYGINELDELKRTLSQIVSLDPRSVIHGRGTFKTNDPEKQKQEEEQFNLNPRLYRENFVLDFDTFRLFFSPHPSERKIVIKEITTTRSK